MIKPHNTMPQEADVIRKKVKESYADAIREAGSCCGGSERHLSRDLEIAYVSELELLGNDAPVSFGCGNPLALADIRMGDTVLDLGSGAGLDLLAAAEKVGPTGLAIGVDMTPDMIDKARQNADSLGYTNVEVRQGLIEELPVESNSVDWVISNCVINLSPEKGKVFAEIFRVLKPGGRFSVSDIVAENLPENLTTDDDAYCACIGGAISEADYVGSLAAAGFVTVQVTERTDYGEEACGVSIPAESRVTSIRVQGAKPDA
jgi:SAM-dependent methyltransferase